jgi:hypothetical protein
VRIGKHIEAAITSESGVVLAWVMVAIVAAFLLATASISIALGGHGGIFRDQSSKAALAAADSGLTSALVRYSGSASGPSLPCPRPGQTPEALAANGWCPPRSASVAGWPGHSFTFYARPTVVTGSTIELLEIVAVGEARGQSRRIRALADGDILFRFRLRELVECRGAFTSANPASGC